MFPLDITADFAKGLMSGAGSIMVASVGAVSKVGKMCPRGPAGCMLASFALGANAFIQTKKALRSRAVEIRANNAVKPQIDVVGLGLSRTGTVSLWKALEDLGKGPTWHGLDCFVDEAGMGCWEKFDQTDDPKYLWGALQDKHAATEYPPYEHAKAMLDQFPNGKFVLTTREASSWAQSVKSNLFRLEDKQKVPIVKALGAFSDKFHAARQFGEQFEKHVEKGVFGGNVTDEEQMAQAMDKHTQAMIKLIPAKQLLILPLEMSGPEKLKLLCEFLGEEVPEGMQYPEANKGDAIRKTAEKVLTGKPFDRTGFSYR